MKFFVLLLLLFASWAEAAAPRCDQGANYACAVTGSQGAATQDLATDTRITGVNGLRFSAITAPSCAAGEYKIFIDTADQTMKKCQNGTTSAITGGGGSPSWDTITAPAAGQTLSMGANTTTWNWSTGLFVNTWTGNTGTNFLASFKDATGNTGTGAILEAHSVGTSTAKPIQFTAQGTANGVAMDSTGQLAKIGTGTIVGTSVSCTDCLSATQVASGALLLNEIGNPAGSPVFTMSPNNLTFNYTTGIETRTWGSSTSAGINMFSLSDGASNTGTGAVLAVSTGSGSAALPFKATAGGTANGVSVSTTGVLAKIGTGSVVADNLSLASQATGDMAYNNAGTWTRVPAGAANTVLKGNGAAAPTFGALVIGDFSANLLTGAKISNSFLQWNEIITTGGTSRTLSNTPRNIGTNRDAVLVASNGIVQKQVASAPGANEYTQSGAVLTWAADPGDVIAFYETDL